MLYKDKRHNKDLNTDRRENRLAKLARKNLDEKSQKRSRTRNHDYE
jgi:hypothetical protein